MTIKELKKYVDAEIRKGNGDMTVMISDDDEGNGYHYVWYAFTPATDFDYVEGMDESVAPKDKTLILG